MYCWYILRMRLSIPIIILAICFSSCKGSNKLATANESDNVPERRKMACGKVHVDMNQPHIDWFEENNSILNKSTELLVLPKDYKVYALDTSQLRQFFAAVANSRTVNTVVPLPKPAECQLFTVTNNVQEGIQVTKGATMGEGECKGQKMGISYFRGQLAGIVNWFGIEYEIKTVFIEGSPYALVYSKMPPPENKHKRVDYTEPVIQEIKYDK